MNSKTSPPPASSRAEVALVLGLPVVIFVLASLRDLLNGGSLPFDSDGIRSLLVVELCLGLWTLFHLRRTGWRWSIISTKLARSDLGHALLLFIATLAVSWLGNLIARQAGLGEPYSPTPGTGVNVGLWLALVLINPLFEEGLWLAYAFNGPFPRNSRAAFATSVICRTAIHLGQGWTALYGILPLSLLWAGYYRRYGRLFPVILTHAVMNFFSIIPYLTGTSAG